jgi:hypothetical protein
MSLYRHQLFTINLRKVITVHQNADEAAVTIRTDDQRKIEISTETPQEATDLLTELADEWEKTVGPLLRHGTHVFLAAAIYSIQAQGDEVFVYFRDHSVSFAASDEQQALDILAELSTRWEAAIAQTSAS